MEQRSKEWHEARKGRFTASTIFNILGAKGLGETGKTHAFEKAVDIVFGYSEEEEFIPYDMQRGIELEPFAFRKFREEKEAEFMQVEKCTFFPFGDNAGASPDGLVGDKAILEIKCPKPNKFFRLVAEGTKAIDTKYISQMQMQMLCTNSDRCYFYNYIIFNGQEMGHEIIIERDNAMCDFIQKRIIEAVIVRDEYCNQLIVNKQF